jgi:hypothetical protein
LSSSSTDLERFLDEVGLYRYECICTCALHLGAFVCVGVA